MLPRADVVDPRPFPAARRVVRGLAWWRTRSPGWFLVVHSAIAGALQLTALVLDLVRAQRPVPELGALAWAWVGLAVIATIPAAVTQVVRMIAPAPGRRERTLQAFAVGLAFYAVLPALALAGALRPLAILIPVAVAWHTVLGAAPASALDARPRAE
jgi:uncharacterized membrane protein